MDNIGSKNPPALLAEGTAESRTFFLRLDGPWPDRVSVALGGRELCRPDYRVERDRYPYLVLELVTGGLGRVSLDGVIHRLESGVCFASATSTACVIETDPREPLEKFFFALAGSEAEPALASAGLLDGRVRRVTALGELRSLAEDIVREGRRHGPAAPSICARLAEVILLKIGEEPTPGSAGRPSSAAARENFERCRALIDGHAARWRGLEEIAAAARLEPSSVCRLFRRFAGVSPHRYLLRRKMALAAALLVEGEGRVQDVAARVGMEDPFHFSRAFRAVHGVPPSAVLGARRTRISGD